MAPVVVVSGDVIETYLRSIWKGELMGLGPGLDIKGERGQAVPRFQLRQVKLRAGKWPGVA